MAGGADIQDLEIDPVDSPDSFRQEGRVLCEVQGKLIVAVLLSTLAVNVKAFLDGVAISTHKVARQLSAAATNWAQQIQLGAARHLAFIQKMPRRMARYCIKSTHRHRPSLEDRLAEEFGDSAGPSAEAKPGLA